MKYNGGCHCGAVRFEVEVTEYQAIICNCSICEKKGFIHLIVPEKKFTLIKGLEDLNTYQFNTKIAKHLFCSHCGIHSFYRPRSHPDSFDVNVRCLDSNVLSKFTIKYFDGRHWEENIDQIRSDND